MKDVVTHLIKPKFPYNPNVRNFALVLSLKSKSAYKWIRKKVSNRLPAVRTLRTWNANSNANCSTESGFNSQTISTLKVLADKKKAIEKELYVSLSYDEVSIRQHVQWIHSAKQFNGFVNYAKRDDDEVPVANYALFFLVTLVESGESMIFAYFLIKYLNAIEKSELIKNVIGEINNTGCYLLSIAFDGLPTNFSACERLGASFDIENFKPFIDDSINSKKICIILDPPHCIKLIRNCLAAKKSLTDENIDPICWLFFENLVSAKGDLVSHKMTRKHIDFHSNKMNVKIAAQTLSFSVANSMELLLKSGANLFARATGTIIFTKNFNKAFDIFNSKHSDSNNLFKRGLNLKNADKIFEFLDYFSKYLKSLKFQGVNILETDRKTGFLGFLMNIEAMRYFYSEFILKNKIENIFFFFYGQDLLESLFGRIRSMLGANTNPTAEQLKGVTRQLINYNEIQSSEFANCEDKLNILSVASTVKRNTNLFGNESKFSSIDNENAPSLISNVRLNFKQSHTIKLRAGTIEKKIRYAIPHCVHEQCRNIFKTSTDKIDGIFYENGIAQRPTNSTVKICEIIYKIFIIYNDIFNFDYSKIYKEILRAIPFEGLYTHIDFSHNLEHKSQFILLIVDEYIRIHATYLARLTTIQIHSKIFGKSAQKLKHFLGQ